MIRLLHSSDWHLGRHLFGRSLHDEQAHAIEKFLELIDQVMPHGVLISGDIFDRSMPPENAVGLLNHFLNQAAGIRNVPVFLIPGNHDSNERLGFAANLLRDRGVTIFASIEDSFRPAKIIGDSGSEVLVYGIPFVEPIIIAKKLEERQSTAARPGVEPRTNDFLNLTTPDAAIGALCNSLLEQKPEPLPSILLCHAFVTGGESSESEKDLFVGGSSFVNANAFEGFAYVALGHLHKPQSVGSENIRYSGSLLPYSKSEISHTKCILEIQIDENGKVQTQTHHLNQLRELRSIEGSMAELISNGAADMNRDDFIIASYTDSGAVLDARSKLLAIYPHLLNVTRAQQHSPALQPALARERSQLNELDLFTEFFSASTGMELSSAERESLLSAIQELSANESRL